MNGWKTKPLGELCEVLDRYRKPITKSDRREGPYPYYGAMGIVDYVDGFLFNEPLILLGEDGAKWGSGEPCAFKAAGKYWVNNHAHIMRPDRSQVLDDWLVYYLCGADLLPFITGLTVPKLNQERMREIPIPVPPLEEQWRIVAVLDEAFAAITTATANAEKNLADVEELLVAAIRAEFGNPVLDWQTQPFDACIEKVKYPAKIQRRDFKSEGTFPIISQEADFINGYWNDSKDVLKVPSPLLVFGDHTQVLKYVDFDFVLGADGVKLLLPKKFLNARFLLYFLKANPMESKGYARHYRHLKGLMVPVPSLAEQQRIAGRLDDISRAVTMLAEAIERKVELHSELRQSLLHRAFTGDLTATMPETIAA